MFDLFKKKNHQLVSGGQVERAEQYDVLKEVLTFFRADIAEDHMQRAWQVWSNQSMNFTACKSGGEFASVSGSLGGTEGIAGRTWSARNQAWPRKIATQTSFSTDGTLHHEMLHFICHDNFWRTFDGNTTLSLFNEGITEWFTRKMKPSRNHYRIEFGVVAESWSKNDEVLRNVFFRGDQEAIDELKRAVDF